MFNFRFFCDLPFFSLGVLCEGSGVCHPPPLIPANLEELRQRITTTLQTATQDMLLRVWEQLGYRIDVCRVSGGAIIGHL